MYLYKRLNILTQVVHRVRVCVTVFRMWKSCRSNHSCQTRINTQQTSMPYKYQFDDNNAGGRHFECQLQCNRCTYVNETTQNRCRRNVFGLRMCWQHTIMVSHLRIKESTLPNAGKGLFVQSKNHANNAIVFRNPNVICSYIGEHLTNDQLDQRYGRDRTANYATQGITRNDNIDSACLRGIGSLINHNNNPNAEIRLQRVGGQQMVRVVAIRPIRNGQEIFINYGPQYIFNEPNVSAVTKTGRVRRVR